MISLYLTLGYQNTDFTRKYIFSDIDASIASSIKAKIKNLNTSLSNGTDEGLSSFFVSNNGDALKTILLAQFDNVRETPIDLEGSD